MKKMTLTGLSVFQETFFLAVIVKANVKTKKCACLNK